jgi:hypothetical protein
LILLLLLFGIGWVVSWQVSALTSDMVFRWIHSGI